MSLNIFNHQICDITLYLAVTPLLVFVFVYLYLYRNDRIRISGWCPVQLVTPCALSMTRFQLKSDLHEASVHVNISEADEYRIFWCTLLLSEWMLCIAHLLNRTHPTNMFIATNMYNVHCNDGQESSPPHPNHSHPHLDHPQPHHPNHHQESGHLALSTC